MPQSNNLLVFIDNMRIGGTQECIVNLCSELDEFNITILSIFGENDYQSKLERLPNVTIKHLFAGKLESSLHRLVVIPIVLYRFAKLRVWLKTNFVWTNVRLPLSMTVWWMFGMCKITKCHFNIDCDARQLTIYERLAFELCLPSFDSVSIAKSIRKGYEYLKLKSCQVKDDPFFVTVRNDVLAIEYENTYNLLFVSRLVPQKGLMDALRIMLAINESSKGTVQLHVIGDGPQRILGEQYCKDYNINCVTFYGFRTDLNRFFERCDGIMKVSYGEPANSVVREALYSGKRVFSTIESSTDLELADSGLLIAIDRNSPEVTALDILDCLKADRLDSKHQETIRKLFSTIYSVDSAKAFYLNLIKCQ